MQPNRIASRLVFPLLALGLLACSDTPPTAPAHSTAELSGSGEGIFHRYVAVGTSVSMGVQSDGVYRGSQVTSWPAQLARLGGRELGQPYISGTGCGAPLAAPLASGVRISGEGAASAPDSRHCAPLEPGISLPTGNVAVDGARTSEALTRTAVSSPTTLRDRQYSRVLPPGETQVSAMIAQNPKIVSVELGANELLGARSGVYLPGVTVVPTAEWKPQYARVLDAVAGVAKHAVLVGLTHDAMDFPSFRTGLELWNARASFAPFNVQVAEDCGTANAANVLFVAVRVPDAVARGVANARAGAGPHVLSCVNAPSASGIADYVLAPEEIAALNRQLAEMNDFIRQEAVARGFAHFELQTLYGDVNQKAPFSAVVLMTSPQPYGPYFSLDGFHPSAEGARVLADAAAMALNERYDLRIPLSSGSGALLVAR